jgi:hypothetical protein
MKQALFGFQILRTKCFQCLLSSGSLSANETDLFVWLDCTFEVTEYAKEITWYHSDAKPSSQNQFYYEEDNYECIVMLQIQSSSIWES